jgi:hypothetical protein
MTGIASFDGKPLPVDRRSVKMLAFCRRKRRRTWLEDDHRTGCFFHTEMHWGAIQMVAPVIRENYAAFNGANRIQGDRPDTTPE